MTSDLLLAKPNLPNDWIDASVGEAYLVRNNLYKYFYKYLFASSLIEDLSYPDPIGYEPLVKLLEDKYNAPVIITNGAKNGLGATFYALKKLGWNYCEMKNPYWALIPQLATMHGINFDATTSILNHLNHWSFYNKGPLLLLSPNNPDGHCEDSEELLRLDIQYKINNIPLIHDGVYYNHIYLPKDYKLYEFGDVQIYSASKLFGLSGLRIGWVVCHNKDFYRYIKEYMEAMTVGVSTISQSYIYNLMFEMNRNPELTSQFEESCFNDFLENKKIVNKINPKILDLPKDLENIPGMFLFAKQNDYHNNHMTFKNAKINIADGKHFGMPGYIRMNLAFDKFKMQEIVDKINNAV